MKQTILMCVLAVLMTPLVLADSHAPGMAASTFAVMLSPSKSVPPVVGSQEMGSATIQFNVHRGMDGMVDMVIVDFRVNYTLGSEQTIRAMHIHKGGTGMNGPVVVNANFGPPATVPPSSGSFFRHSIVNDPMQIKDLMEIMEHPDMFYLNVHTASNPAGHMRGQLMSADAARTVAMDTNMGVMKNAMHLERLDAMLRTIADGLGLTLPPPPTPEPK